MPGPFTEGNPIDHTVSDGAGTVWPFASVQVNVHGGGAASLFSDAGRTVSVANPLTAGSDGAVRFFVAAGDYDFVATSETGAAHTVYVTVAQQVADTPVLQSSLAAQLAAYAPVIRVGAATGVTATDWANTSAAVTKAQAVVAAGGTPTVLFDACPYSGGTLTPYSLGAHAITISGGITYVGAPPILSEVNQGSGYLPDGEWTFIGGTVLKGDGTNYGFWDGKTDQVSVVNPTFGQGQTAGVDIYGFGFDTFLDGIKTGAKNAMGLVWSNVDQLYFRNCGWGGEFINYQHVTFGMLASCSATVGNLRFASMVPGATLTPGNSSYRHLFAKTPNANNNVRGIVWEGISGGTGALTVGQCQSVQVNAYNRVAVSQTATFANTSSTVAVTDGTKFAVGMPVVFTTTAAGFTKGVNYYALTVAGNNLTLGLSMHASAAIVANASTTATITTQGFHGIEVATDGGLIDGSFEFVDVEDSAGATGIYFEQATRTTIAQVTAGQIVGRSASISLYYTNGFASADFDTNSFRSRLDGLGDCTWTGGFIPGGVRQAGSANEVNLSLDPDRSLKTDVWPAGNYRSSFSLSSTFTAQNLVNQTMYLTAIDIPDRTLTAIGVNVTTAGNAGAVVRLGLYNCQNGLPGSLVADYGTIDGSTTGYKEIVISQLLPAGTYWLAAVGQGISTSVVVSGHSPSADLGATTGAGAATGQASGFYVNPIAGALPGTCTPAGTTTASPRVLVK